MWSKWIGDIELHDGGELTGFLLGPNDLVTNTHALDESGDWPGGTVSFDEGRYTAGLEGIRFLDDPDLWEGGSIPYNKIQHDLAVIELDRDIGDELGYFGWAYGSDNRPDALNVAGYPGSPYDSDTLKHDYMDVAYDLSNNVINYYSETVHQGSSGSPLWMFRDDSRYVVGVHSASDDASGEKHAALFTERSVDFLREAMDLNDDGGSPSPNPPGPPSGEPPEYVVTAARLYEAGLARAFDPGGLNHWIDRLEDGASYLDLADGFLDSAEFTQRFGDDDTMSIQSFVSQMYHNVLGRDGDPAGFANWVDNMLNGMSREEVLLGFANSPENVNNTGYLGSLQELTPGYWDLAIG